MRRDTSQDLITLLLWLLWLLLLWRAGWYQGERLRDGERGWFPGNYSVEIASAHVRARNLRQRYRLLALSANFIEEKARKERGSKDDAATATAAAAASSKKSTSSKIYSPSSSSSTIQSLQ